MAYSGTVGKTVITVQQFIDQGARMAGKLAEQLTVEQVQAAKQALFFILSNLANQGINYWAISKQVYGLIPGQYEYLLPLGGYDVLNALYRYITFPTGGYKSSDGQSPTNVYSGNLTSYFVQNVPNGNIEVDFGPSNTQTITSIGFVPYVANFGSATWSYQFQTSADNVNWQTLYTASSVTVTDGQWVWQDIDGAPQNEFYRMVATNGTTLSLRALYFGENTTEITMSRLNRDDYTNLPNKGFEANQPFQYWFNKLIPQSSITLWPTPNNAFVQMTIWYARQIMDVGALSGQLEIPQRWNQAIQAMLAHQMSLILPNVELARIQYLEGQGEKYFIMAENEERDRSPIFLTSNIGVYTK